MQKSNAPTPGQCGILAFFGKPVPSTGRQASIVITNLLADGFNSRRWTIERARRYLVGMEAPRRAPDDPQDSHMVVFNAARALLHGFNLSQSEAQPLLAEYCGRSDLPWSSAEIAHKLHSVDAQQSKFPRGYLVSDMPSHPSAATKQAAGVKPEREVRAKVEFDPKRLAALAKQCREDVTLIFLANRSAVDPATVDANYFLQLLYRSGEKVLVFSDYFSQGQAVWPDDPLPTTGKLGVWFLPAPVDGKYHANPRSIDPKTGNARQSRRSEESVTAFRYILLESDKADARDWLRFIVQVPLCIDAIYTSGGRSIHALVRVDCTTKGEWEARKKAMMPFLMGCVMMGGDRGVLSGVRLSRLPACWREGKEDDQGRYVRFTQPKAQKLLYVRPDSDERPISDMPALRAVEKIWGERGLKLVDGYEPAPGEPSAAAVVAALRYYANVYPAYRAILVDLEGLE